MNFGFSNGELTRGLRTMMLASNAACVKNSNVAKLKMIAVFLHMRRCRRSVQFLIQADKLGAVTKPMDPCISGEYCNTSTL